MDTLLTPLYSLRVNQSLHLQQLTGKKHLTVLSFGGGQDSTYILYKIIRDACYRAQFVQGDFIVVMTDTGDEHLHTYQHVEFIRQLCALNGIEFYFLTADQGYHPNTWPSLISQLQRNSTIMSMMFPRSCTDNLKIKPFYNFLNVYIGRKYYGQQLPESTRNKTWIKRFAAENGKINVILGIAAGEEQRIKQNKTQQLDRQLQLFKTPKKRSGTVWMENCVTKSYPMIAEQINRQMAQNYILASPWPLPRPSNCKRCPFLSKQEILWLYRFFPADFNQWVDLEKAKIIKCADRETNLGVKGEKLLPEILQEAIFEYGHWSDEQLQEYKMSHGHCVLSKY
jgi:hypothetical protein